MTTANKIREARESANLTQKQLADMLGIPARKPSNYTHKNKSPVQRISSTIRGIV